MRDLEAPAADHELVAVAHVLMLEGDTGGAMDEDRRPHRLGQIAVARDVVGMGVRLEDVADREALLGGEAEILGHAVTAGIDHEGLPGLATADQVREAARLFVEDLLEDHWALFYPRPPTALVLLGFLPLALGFLDDLVGQAGR